MSAPPTSGRVGLALRRLTPILLAGFAACLPATRAAAGPAAQQVDGTVMWIAVSPAFTHTGLVLASVSAPGCAQSCLHLWATHDGGAQWEQLAAAGWGQGRFSIAVDAAGREVVFGESASGLQRSDDQGGSWRDAGPGGAPAVSPEFARDATVAVAAAASGEDYLLRDAVRSPVEGSAGRWADLGFMLAPSYPSGGRFAPVLLSAADRQSQVPMVLRCDAAFHCKDAVTLAGAGPWALPVSLYPSAGYAQDGTVFAKAGRTLFKSTDGAATFLPLTVLPDSGGSVTAYPMLAPAPDYRETGPTRTLDVAALQVTVDSADPKRSRSTGGVYRSTDGGATWARLGSPSRLDGGASAVAVAPQGRLFAGYVGGPQGAAGLLCSTDGAHWAPLCPPVVSPATAARTTARPAAGVAGSGACSADCAGAATAPGGQATSAIRSGGAVDRNPAARVATAIPTSSSNLPWLLTTAVIAITVILPFSGRRAWRRARRASLRPIRRPERPDRSKRRNLQHVEQVLQREPRDGG